MRCDSYIARQNCEYFGERIEFRKKDVFCILELYK